LGGAPGKKKEAPPRNNRPPPRGDPPDPNCGPPDDVPGVRGPHTGGGSLYG